MFLKVPLDYNMSSWRQVFLQCIGTDRFLDSDVEPVWKSPRTWPGSEDGILLNQEPRRRIFQDFWMETGRVLGVTARKWP